MHADGALMDTAAMAPLDQTAIVLYFVLLGICGYFTRRSQSFSDYAVGRHSVPATMVFASLAAAIIGPGFSVGSAGKAYDGGFLFYFLCLSYAAQTIAVGFFIAPRLTAHRDCSTLGDIMRKCYGRQAQLLTGLICIGLLVGFTAVMGRIGAEMLGEITGWPLATCLIAVTGATALLTFTGGVRATVATEALQFVLFAAAVPVMLWIALSRGPASLQEVSQRASELTAQGFAHTTALQMFAIALSFMLGEALQPTYVNRALAARSASGSRAGFVAAGSYVAVWLAIIALIGIVGRIVLPANLPPDSVFVALARHVLPVGMYGLLLAALLGIVMSSQEATLNSASVSLVRDVVPKLAELPDRVSLALAKFATLLLAALSILISRYSPSIIDGLMILYSVWAPTILLPLIAALYIKEPRPLAGGMAIVAGGVVSLAWRTLLHEPHGIPAILTGLGAAGLAYYLGHTLGRPVAASPTQVPARP